MYEIFNIFFFVFHTSLIVFNMLGWIWEKTRKANLAVLLLTAFSWFILGIWYGFGFCPCTEWHWQVRARLGYHDMPASYLVFLIQTFTGWEVSKTTVDICAVIFLSMAVCASIYTNVRDWRKSRS